MYDVDDYIALIREWKDLKDSISEAKKEGEEVEAEVENKYEKMDKELQEKLKSRSFIKNKTSGNAFIIFSNQTQVNTLLKTC